MTSYGNEDIAIRAIKLGADDYLNKEDLSLNRFNQHVNEILKAQDKNTGDASGQDKVTGYEETVPLSTKKLESIKVLAM
jgi:ActR/RegA family two-component response regulator